MAGRQDGVGHRDHVFVVESPVGRGRRERAADPHHRDTADLQVQVRGPGFDRDLQEVVDVHVLDYRLARSRAAVSRRTVRCSRWLQRPGSRCTGRRALSDPLEALGAHWFVDRITPWRLGRRYCSQP